MKSACPIDARELSVRKADELDVMGCQACGGAWLPATSAGALLSRLATAAPPQQRFFDKVRLEGGDSRFSCIECGTAMRVIGHRGVEIDVCQDCGGIWFDGGELQRFRRQGVATASPVAEPAAAAKPAAVAAPAKRGKGVKAGAVVAGAAALAAPGVAGAAALNAARPAPQLDGVVSEVGEVVVEGVLEVVGDVAVDGVLEVVGDLAGSAFSAILESIFS